MKSEIGHEVFVKRENGNTIYNSVRNGVMCISAGMTTDEWYEQVRADRAERRREASRKFRKTEHGRMKTHEYNMEKRFKKSLEKKGLTKEDHAVIVMQAMMDEVAPVRGVYVPIDPKKYIRGCGSKMMSPMTPTLGKTRVENNSEINSNGLRRCECGNIKVRVLWSKKIDKYYVECPCCGRRVEERQVSAIRRRWNERMV